MLVFGFDESPMPGFYQGQVLSQRIKHSQDIEQIHWRHRTYNETLYANEIMGGLGWSVLVQQDGCAREEEREEEEKEETEEEKRQTTCTNDNRLFQGRGATLRSLSENRKDMNGGQLLHSAYT